MRVKLSVGGDISHALYGENYGLEVGDAVVDARYGSFPCTYNHKRILDKVSEDTRALVSWMKIETVTHYVDTFGCY